MPQPRSGEVEHTDGITYVESQPGESFNTNTESPNNCNIPFARRLQKHLFRIVAFPRSARRLQYSDNNPVEPSTLADP